MAGLTPIGVVLRGLEIHAGELPPVTCILDGYVVYSFESSREEAAGDGSVMKPEQNKVRDEQSIKADAEGDDHGVAGGQSGSNVPTAPGVQGPSEDELARVPDDDGDSGDDEDEDESGYYDGEELDGEEESFSDATPHAPNSSVDGRSPEPKTGAISSSRPVGRAPAMAYGGMPPMPTRRRGRQSSTITYKPQCSIRTKLRSLGYAEDDIIIFLVERFRKTALDRLTWLEAYKLQQMVDKNEVPTLTSTVRS